MNVGLIGYGFMGGAHLAAMQKLPDVTVVAVASRTRPSADSPVRGNLKLQTGPLPDSVRWFPDWQQIVRDPSIDAVDICLPTHLHKQVILSAFRHGKHVLCEKPMALTPADCDELLDAAQRAGRTFMVAQVLRFMFPYRYAADFIRSVGHDAIEGCTLQRSTGYPQWGSWLKDEACSGGAIMDLLIHDLDQALLWFGEPESVCAVSMGAIDTAHAELQVPGGLRVEITGGWLVPEVEFSTSFEIRARSASLDFHDGKLHKIVDGVSAEVEVPAHDPFAEEIGYFVECCMRGTAPHRCLPADSAKAVQLATLLKRSRAEQGRELAWTYKG